MSAVHVLHFHVLHFHALQFHAPWFWASVCFASSIFSVIPYVAHYGRTVSAEWLLLTIAISFINSLSNATVAELPFPQTGSLHQIALQIGAKPRSDSDMFSLLLNLPTPYPTVPSPTTYGQLFSQNMGSRPPFVSIPQNACCKAVRSAILATAVLAVCYQCIQQMSAPDRATTLANASWSSSQR